MDLKFLSASGRAASCGVLRNRNTRTSLVREHFPRRPAGPDRGPRMSYCNLSLHGRCWVATEELASHRCRWPDLRDANFRRHGGRALAGRRDQTPNPLAGERADQSHLRRPRRKNRLRHPKPGRLRRNISRRPPGARTLPATTGRLLRSAPRSEPKNEPREQAGKRACFSSPPSPIPRASTSSLLRVQQATSGVVK